MLEGGYHAAEPWSGDHLDELPGDWGLAHVMIEHTEQEVAQYFRTGRKIIVGAHNWGFLPQKKLPWEKTNKWDLRRDWEESYARLETLLRPFKGQIFAVEIADEPAGRGILPVRLETAIEWWESKGYPTIVNEQLSRLSRPMGVTHFAITCYQQDKATGCWKVDWDACRSAHEATGADVVLGFGFQAWGCQIREGDLAASRQLASDVGVEALLWFLWPSSLGMQGMDSVR